MARLCLLTVLCCLMTALSAHVEEPLPANLPEDAVALVNMVLLTRDDLRDYAYQSTGRYPMSSAEEQAVLDELISFELMAQDALRNAPDQTPAFQAEIADIHDNDTARQRMTARYSKLAKQALDTWMSANMSSDEQLRRSYQNQVTQLTLPDEYHISHIMLNTESAAHAVILALSDGKDFAALAEEYSIDKASASRGGSLGLHKMQAVMKLEPAFAKALSQLNAGQYTQKPIQSPLGWHIIYLSEVRASKPPPFERIARTLRAEEFQRQKKNYINKLYSEARVRKLLKAGSQPVDKSLSR